MSIQEISKTIKKVIEGVRIPLMEVPAILLVCSTINRPGLSAKLTAANIIRRQSEAGVPVGRLCDGSSNSYEAMEVIRVEEIFKAIKFQSRVDSSIPIGGIQFVGTGGNAGGPVVIQGFNTNNPNVKGIVR